MKSRDFKSFFCFTLKDYWTPKKGNSYEKDIRDKFPGESAEETLNIEKYAESLIKDSWAKATEYVNNIN